MNAWLDPVVRFLSSIGIESQARFLPESCFLPGVCIDQGRLQFDATKIVAASDLLHEAGHIAVTPKAIRTSLSGQLDSNLEVAYGGEVEAIAWSFAAAMELDMPLDELFHPQGYRGHAAGLAFGFSMGVYPGAHGLVCAGMALAGQYPKLSKWLRD